MAHLITFATGKFDVSKETPNDINPIAGEGVLNWIRGRLAGTQFSTTMPSTEDWGWYIDVKGDGSSYMVGASGEPERPPPDVDWVVQIHKRRSLKDKLTGRNKLTSEDALVALLEKAVRAESEFRDVAVRADA
jgi:hypothetical protein